ncbi:Nitrous oxide reductase maturation protein NosR [Paramagnetospirillum magnetotacticum MS-1]|uniref:Nitrous oxide reductase maturation protein NosR n=1 Tax=Paramagnetospirillum magnetotacticum MS-1 TaxID=272627 RepID=A0A0C2YID2_PARME|nr:4Fe-4S binding protein [Paramagnetospirillum magnetotacticum]KIL99499.1 Nitrous oxide reductase maturation protein NosR [Paramagnetospirillum magnetotacticum MS-1]
MRRLLLVLLPLLICCQPAWARLNHRDLAAMITPPLQLGAPDPALPIWTLLDGGGAFTGYIFESKDLAPIPGFSGAPINLLISMDRNGTFLDVRLLDQNEPVFVSGLGPRPLYEFLRQYTGLSLAHNIKVGGAHDQGRDTSANTWVDGVSKATASVRIANETILASALMVAREKLAAIAPKPAGRPRPDAFKTMSWDDLVAAGLIGHLRLGRAEVEKAFAGTGFAEEGDGAETMIDLYFADLGLPVVARNLLTEDTRRRMARHVESWEEPVLVLASGPLSITGEDFVRNSVPDRLMLRQAGFPISLRDADVEPVLQPGLPGFAEGLILRVDTRLGFDPASLWSLGVRVVRRHGYMRTEVAARDFPAAYHPPSELFLIPEVVAPAPPWLSSWSGRWSEITALLGFLAALTAGLAGRSPWLARAGRLWSWRMAALLVTLVFIGWYGQGQLSIVNLTALITTLRQGGSLAFFLYDPFTVIVWLYTLPTLLVWGRGTFCGWLCPFGALQEVAGELALVLKLRQRPLPARLGLVKYAVLAVVLASLGWEGATDKAVEVEPFKTAITLGFDRSWPFVAYGLAVLALGLVVYKGYCRVLCPLGAALALMGHLRRWDWISRRDSCGTPCRLCEVRCRYGAIARSGRVAYDECFQCLDCVSIHDDPGTCVPLVLAKRKGRPCP